MYEWLKTCFRGSKSGAVVRVLASHQCDLGSNPGVEATCGLGLLLVLSLALWGFSQGTQVFPSHQKPTTLPNSNSIWNPWTRLNEFIRTPNYFVGKQITIITIASEAGRGLFLSSPFSRHERSLPQGRNQVSSWVGFILCSEIYSAIMCLFNCIYAYTICCGHIVTSSLPVRRNN